MTQPLRIAVADDEQDMRDYFSRVLPLLGHRVVVTAADGEELVAGCLSERPDLVITDVRMPNVDGLEAAWRLSREWPVPVIVVSAFHDPELICRAGGEHVMASLVKPIRRADLEPAIDLAMQRFGRLQELAETQPAKG